MTIYIDVVFIENVLMNYIILLATSCFCGKKIKVVKILLSSCVGGVYVIINYILNLSDALNTFFKIIISILMVKIIFNTKSYKQFLKQLMLFYVVSFTFGGISFMLLFLVKPKNIIQNEGYLLGIYPVKMAVLGCSIGLFIIMIVSVLLRKRVENQICDIEIFYAGKHKIIKSFIDTGNFLKEPATGQDVIVVEKDSLVELVDYAFLDNVDKIMTGNLLSSGIDFIKDKISLIPFSSLGNENGMLVGFRPDYIKIYRDEVKIQKKVVIGIYNGKLTKSNLYTGLIGLNILKESDIND